MEDKDKIEICVDGVWKDIKFMSIKSGDVVRITNPDGILSINKYGSANWCVKHCVFEQDGPTLIIEPICAML